MFRKQPSAKTKKNNFRLWGVILVYLFFGVLEKNFEFDLTSISFFKKLIREKFSSKPSQLLKKKANIFSLELPKQKIIHTNFRF